MSMNVSFAGCGFLGVYHVGVACCFRRFAPQLLLDKIAGASAGAIAACCLICNLSIDELVSDVLRVITDARKRTLGPFSPSFDVQKLLRDGLEKFLPSDAHRRVSGRLRVSLTRVKDFRNVIVSEFNTRDELIQVLLASAWVPVFSGILPPSFRGTRYMDGGLSDNLPTFDQNTITVSPFCGETDICPRDPTEFQFFNVNLSNTSIELSSQNLARFSRILFPPDPEALSKLCHQGFEDALRFLRRNNMLGCSNCITVKSTFVLAPKNDDCVEYESKCETCKQHREEAMASSVPESVHSVFQDAIDRANRGIMNWLYRRRGVKLLTLATVPYVLPIELSYVACTKTLALTPVVFGIIKDWTVSKLRSLLKSLLYMDLNGRTLADDVICQLAVSHCGESCPYAEHLANKNHLNVKFKVDLHGERVTHIEDKILSRRSSLVLPVHNENTGEAVDNILKVTHNHDALLAFYFVDGKEKMSVTEIFEVTPAESEAIFTPTEDETGWVTSDTCPSDLSVPDEDAREDNDTIFSDPESEWKTGRDCRPEDEQHRLD